MLVRLSVMMLFHSSSVVENVSLMIDVADIVDKNFDTAEASYHLLDAIDDLPLLRNVEFQRKRVHPVFLPVFSTQGVARLVAALRNHDLRARLRQAPADHLADADGSGRHERHFAFDVENVPAVHGSPSYAAPPLREIHSGGRERLKGTGRVVKAIRLDMPGRRG